LRGKSFVQFNQVDLTQTKLLSLQQRTNGWDRSNSHDVRRNASYLIIDDARMRLRAEFFD